MKETIKAAIDAAVELHTYELDAAVDAVAKLLLPNVDVLAQAIREIDGWHEMGAGALAEAIIERLKA